MIILKNLDGEIYNLFTKPEHIIGRFGNLILPNDSSVSRQHACIKITIKNGESKIYILDLGSKYGTYVNDGIDSLKAIPKNEPVSLKIGDKIRFGQQWNTWIIENIPFIICTSKLSIQDQKYLNDIISKLNGIILTDWVKNCTHLTITKFTININTICALGHVKPIVSMDYWERLIKMYSSHIEQPILNCDDYIPPFENQQLNLSQTCLKMNNKRKTLFQNMKFIAFGHKQYNSVLPMVEAAGGCVYDGNIFKISGEQLQKEKIIVLQNNNEITNITVSHISSILNLYGLRFIQEIEICLSIVECSVEKYCNPAYNINVLLKFPETQIIFKDEATILVNDTQYTDTVNNIQFQETESNNFSLNVNENRIFSESEDEDMIPDSYSSAYINSTIKNSVSDLNKNKQKISGSLKRKLEPTEEILINAKYSKPDSCIINKNSINTNESENSVLESVNSHTSRVKKNFKDIFNFRTELKINEKNSASLFLNEQNFYSTTLNSENSEHKTSIFVDINGKTNNTTYNLSAINKKNTKTDLTFSGINERKLGRNTNNLFSSSKNLNNINMSTVVLGKRKRSNNIETSTSVNFDLKTKNTVTNLFTSKNFKYNNSVIIDSDNESNDSLPNQTLEPNILKDMSRSLAQPVEILRSISLSQFINVPTEKNVPNIKLEPSELLNQDQEIYNKNIIHIVPLVRTNYERNYIRSTNFSIVNFKKFQKSNYSHQMSNRVISVK